MRTAPRRSAWRRNMLLDDVGGIGMSHVWPRASSHTKAALSCRDAGAWSGVQGKTNPRQTSISLDVCLGEADCR